ncbi:MAG: 2'-5' RNA ligase family protein [Marmoricola sp.]
MAETFLPVIAGIVVPVPELEGFVPWAHITLLTPFGRDAEPSADEIAEVARFCADVTPFDFALTELAAFPSGSRYLCPAPAATFSRLTHRLHRLFPEYPPYAGSFDVVVPHLTVPSEVELPALPLPCHARVAALLHHDENGFNVRETFPFGTRAA